MMGPNPVSVSRSTTLATKAVVTNMKNSVQIVVTWAMAKGAFLCTLPPDPIWIWSIVIEP
jgi:hypothetical protein